MHCTARMLNVPNSGVSISSSQMDLLYEMWLVLGFDIKQTTYMDYYHMDWYYQQNMKKDDLHNALMRYLNAPKIPVPSGDLNIDNPVENS